MSDEIDKATNSVPVNDQPTPAKRNRDHVQKDLTASTNGGISQSELDSSPAKNSTASEHSEPETSAKPSTPSSWVKFENDEVASDKVPSIMIY